MLAPLLGLLACSKPDPTDGPTDTDGEPTTTDSGPTPEDTAPEGTSLSPVYWGLTARFAIDGAAGRAVSFGDRDLGRLPIAFTVTLLSEDALTLGVTDETSCSATFETDGPLAAATWPADQGSWIGFDLPTDGTVHDTCRFYGLPAEYVGELAPHVARWRWGVAIGPLSITVEDALRAQLPASEWDALEPYVVGAGVSSDLFAQSTGASGWIDAGYGLGYEVDASFVLAESALGDPVPLPSAAVWDGTTVGTGYYEVQIGIFDQPSALTYATP
jgi:hypothetical protein